MRKKLGDLMKKYEDIVTYEYEKNGKSTTDIDDAILNDNIKKNTISTKICFENKKREYKDRLATLTNLDINARKLNAGKTL